MNKVIKRQSFTLVEIIAVLLVIGILAAVAAPKFVDLAGTAREKVAQAGINEAKATLSVAYAKAYLEKEGVQPTANEVLANSGIGESFDFGDITVTTAVEGTVITLTATKVGTKTVDGVSDTWNLPSN